MSARTIREIAQEIRKTWANPHYTAEPYIRAMLCLYDVDSMYGCDTAKSIIQYFLSNAATWRGEDARRIKKELSDMVS